MIRSFLFWRMFVQLWFLFTCFIKNQHRKRRWIVVYSIFILCESECLAFFGCFSVLLLLRFGLFSGLNGALFCSESGLNGLSKGLALPCDRDVSILSASWLQARVGLNSDSIRTQLGLSVNRRSLCRNSSLAMVWGCCGAGSEVSPVLSNIRSVIPWLPPGSP